MAIDERRLSLVLGLVGAGLWVILYAFCFPRLQLVPEWIGGGGFFTRNWLLDAVSGLFPAFLIPWGAVRLGAQFVRLAGWIVGGFGKDRSEIVGRGQRT